MKKLLREPLVHFLLAGTCLFAAWNLLNGGAPEPIGEETVSLTEGELAWIAGAWSRQWLRPPTEEELRGLATGYLREKLLAREAESLGLAEGDTVVRRRLALKMQFLVEDGSAGDEPSDAELESFLAERRERFEEPERVSFTQALFSATASGDPASRAQAALAALSEGAAESVPAGLDDAAFFERERIGVSEQELAAEFGTGFARAVFAADSGSWAGPFTSPQGLHLVRISARAPAALPALADARERVLEEWRSRRRQEEQARFVADLMRKYEIVLDDAVRPFVGDPSRVADWSDAIAAEAELSGGGVGQ